MVQLPVLHVHYYFELLHIKNDICNVTDIMRYKSKRNNSFSVNGQKQLNGQT